MGFQTNISILNDHFDWIDKNPETFVKAIRYGMNGGTDSYVTEALERDRAERKGERYYDPKGHATEQEREASAHYVTVHPARHADITQVVFTHQNSAYDLWDYTRGFELQAPSINRNPEFHTKNAREIAKELRRTATRLTDAVREYEQRQEEASDDSA